MSEASTHKIAVLPDSGPPEPPPPEPKQGCATRLFKGILPWALAGTLFTVILSIGVCAGYVFVWRDTPEVVGGEIAVLPFVFQGEEDLYSGPFTEQLLAGISAEPSLTLKPRKLVDPYAADPRGIGEIGAELGVRYVVQGELRPESERLTATITLVDVENGGAIFAADRSSVPLSAADTLDELVLARIRAGVGISSTPPE